MALITYADIDLNISGNTQYAVLKSLSQMAVARGFVNDQARYLQTLLLREKESSTSFGCGVAIPHGKSAVVHQPFVLFARSAQGVDWQAEDGELASCWICLGVPQTSASEQIGMISKLCRKVIYPDFIAQIKSLDSAGIVTLLNATLA
ncbi:PTS fructose transporter subunit IIA [Hafnia alvei]|uniref:PTS system, fructose-specific IIA component/PTS system, nitrogen regulatory IIA component/PTS system, fructose-specific IIA-like component n=1 Tax=Hafnia alvei TaxID=569 RepID=A0A1C6Z5F7_HAFAL|nr:PTS fructose transporter subunit IIA [Hafnia alvei]NLS54951.1 PTS fructose transporter subunit IIA [Hafnia alvei]SCM54311.1 PTS system, fructose-specific IIA component/PTS system, nitrogen regulatory IIA component/PTS system, fructose-specific IIA-like component [Hafnia alvei]